MKHLRYFGMICLVGQIILSGCKQKDIIPTIDNLVGIYDCKLEWYGAWNLSVEPNVKRFQVFKSHSDSSKIKYTKERSFKQVSTLFYFYHIIRHFVFCFPTFLLFLFLFLFWKCYIFSFNNSYDFFLEIILLYYWKEGDVNLDFWFNIIGMCLIQIIRVCPIPCMILSDSIRFCSVLFDNTYLIELLCLHIVIYSNTIYFTIHLSLWILISSSQIFLIAVFSFQTMTTSTYPSRIALLFFSLFPISFSLLLSPHCSLALLLSFSILHLFLSTSLFPPWRHFPLRQLY